MKKQNSVNDDDCVDTRIWPPLLRGMVVILFGVGGFLLWSVKAPLDAGVVADGTVTVSSNRKTLQHLIFLNRIAFLYVDSRKGRRYG